MSVTNLVPFISPNLNKTNLEERVKELEILLDYEKKLRIGAENKLRDLEQSLKGTNLKKKNRTSKNEIEDKIEEIICLRSQKLSVDEIANRIGLSYQAVSKEISYRENSEYKINGVKKSTPADSIRSYTDFKVIQNYFLNKPYSKRYSYLNLRNNMLWTIGVGLGLRDSDLNELKYVNFLNEDKSFKERLYVTERKTKKLNNCLITEAIIDAITMYLDSIDWNINLDDYLFTKSNGGHISYAGVYKILKEAQDELDLPIHMSTHIFRKSFANIAACVTIESVDMNLITTIQGLLNHGNQKTTMKYLGTLQKMYDDTRIAVSDFILGRSDINQLKPSTANTTDEILLKLENIENILSK